jgi:hypothetical protein
MKELLKNFLIAKQNTLFWKVASKILLKLVDLIFEYIVNFNRKLLFFFINLPKQNFKIEKKSIVKIIDDKEYKQDLFTIVKDSLNENIIARARDKIKKAEDKRFFSCDLTQFMSEEDRIKIINWAVSKQTVSNISSYFGYLPYLAGINISLNTPVAGSLQEGSKCWHRDSDVYKSIDIWMNISEVDENSGPFSVISSEYIGPGENVPQDKNLEKTGDAWIDGRITDKHMKSFVSNDQVLTFMGPPGCMLITDSALNYHKGGYCISNERIMVRIYYDAWSTNLSQILKLPREKVLKRINDVDFGKLIIKNKDNKFFKRLSYYLLKILRYNIVKNTSS